MKKITFLLFCSITLHAAGNGTIAFIENRGQIPASGSAGLKYYSRLNNTAYFFCKSGVVSDHRQYTYGSPEPATASVIPGNLLQVTDGIMSVTGHVIRMSFAGNLNPSMELTGTDKLDYRLNYFYGNDRSKWLPDVPSFAGILYKNVWQGINVTYYGYEGKLKYDVIIAPGTNPALAVFSYSGDNGLSVNEAGELIINTSIGTVTEEKPYAYQVINGVKRTVQVSYKLIAPKVYGFQVGVYDPTQELVIDPAIHTINHPHIAYSTYLGGSGFDQPWAIKTDANGNAYIVGETNSLNFPTTEGAYKREKTGSDNTDPTHTQHTTGTTDNGMDIFVSKLNANGSGLVWSTYLGGQAFVEIPGLPSDFLAANEPDFARGIVLDADNNVYITGWTHSSDFPATENSYQEEHNGGSLDDGGGGGSTGHDFYDAYVAKLSSLGNELLYCTFLGGNADDFGIDIGMDSQGKIYVTGVTGQRNDEANTFPVKNAFQPQFSGGTFANGKGYDAFVAKLDISQPVSEDQLVWSTFLGGTEADAATCLTLDASGQLFVGGSTHSSNFPCTPGTLNPKGSSSNSFIAKFSSEGAALAITAISYHSTILGIASGPSNEIYITGRTGNNDAYPIIPPDAFYKLGDQNTLMIMRLNNNLSQLLMSVAFGGNPYQFGDDIIVDADGNAYVTGNANSGLPTTVNAVFASPWRHSEAFLMKVNKSGKILYNTYLGSGGFDWARGIARGTDGSIYITGNTQSTYYPVTSNAFQKTNSGGQSGLSSSSSGASTTGNEGFVTKFHPLQDSELPAVPYYYPKTVTRVQGCYAGVYSSVNRLWFEDMHPYSLKPCAANGKAEFILAYPIAEQASDITGLRVLFAGRLFPSAADVHLRIFNYTTNSWDTLSRLSIMTDYNRRYLDISGTLSNYVSADKTVKLSAITGTNFYEFWPTQLVLYVASVARPMPLKGEELFQVCPTGVEQTKGIALPTAADISKVCDGDQVSYECQNPNASDEVEVRFFFDAERPSSSVAKIKGLFYGRVHNGVPNGTRDFYVNQQREVRIDALNIHTGNWDLVTKVPLTLGYYGGKDFYITPGNYVNADNKVVLRAASKTTDIMATDYFGLQIYTNRESAGSRLAPGSLTEEQPEAPTNEKMEIPAGIDAIAYPNPVSGLTTISCTLPEQTIAELGLYNSLGIQVRMIAQGTLRKGYHEFLLDTHDLEPGLYFYKFSSDAGSLSKRLLILR